MRQGRAACLALAVCRRGLHHRGGAQGNISPSQILDYEIPLPPIEVQEEIVRELEQYQKLIEENNFMTKIGGDEFYPNTTIPIPEEKRSHMYLIPRKDFKNHFTVNYFEV